MSGAPRTGKCWKYGHIAWSYNFFICDRFFTVFLQCKSSLPLVSAASGSLRLYWRFTVASLLHFRWVWHNFRIFDLFLMFSSPHWQVLDHYHYCEALTDFKVPFDTWVIIFEGDSAIIFAYFHSFKKVLYWCFCLQFFTMAIYIMIYIEPQEGEK